MEAMAAQPHRHQHSEFRAALLERRRRLQSVASRSDAQRLGELLGAVDDALDRIEDGSFGICDVCHEAMDRRLLAGDPLAKVCLECLSPDQRRDLERDLELAAAIQARLLPPPDFEAGGWQGHFIYRPHGAVSGDFCDVIRDDDGWLVTIGDVSGKGVAAALLMSHLSAVFRGLAGSGMSLVGIMERANRMFGAAIPTGSFATLVAARLEADGSIEISNAGHVPPLYHNGRVNRLPPDGVPLGMFCESRYTSQRLRLAAGERLVLATDGLIESTGPGHDEFGLEALSAAVSASFGTSPSELAAHLVSEVDRHRAGRPLADDLTLMVIRRQA